MNRLKTFGLSLVMVLALAGCGASPEYVEQTGTPSSSTTMTGSSNGNISIFVVNHNGKEILCIESTKNIGNGYGVGLSCDFGG